MPRIAGIDIPDNKPIRISLRYLYGIGPKNAEKILTEAKIDGQIRANKLTEDQIVAIVVIIDRDYQIEGALRRKVSQDIARLRDIRCYRGDRHRKSLPTRGQRTRTNSRTRKGKRKTVAGKKGVKALK
jgi:small subunit ribosomal protein S13